MKAYLIFEDGAVFVGESIGISGEAVGEIVFTTASTGYVETLTDPSFYGQLVLQSFPLIGNYGAMEADAESDRVHATGYIVRELCERGSNFRKDLELNDFLIKQRVVGISGVDTRELTKKIAAAGVMNAMISDSLKDLPQKISRLKAYRVKGSVENTSVKEVAETGKEDGRRVVLWDFGAKKSMARLLEERGCRVIKVPYYYTAKQIMELKPQGVLLSSGGGNPADNKTIIQEVKALFQHKVPMFGVCLGHQMLCIAAGGKTKKLKFGHRGENQPVKDVKTGRVYITAQNHGYAAVMSSLPQGVAEQRYVSVNDGTCEGIDFCNAPAISVQFHPEASGGPRDTEFIFDRFITLIDEKRHT